MEQKKISRRNFLKAVGMTLGASVLASCAPATSPAAAPTSAGAETAYKGKFVIMSAAYDLKRLQPWLDKMNAAFPGVEFDFRALSVEKYTELFTASEVAGDQIDFMDLNGQDLRRYAIGGKLMDLSNITYKDRFRKVGLDTYTVKGKLWALPVGGIDGFTFLYNKKLLDKIGVTKEPETYDDLKTIAAELKKIGVAPFTHEGKDIYMWPVWQFWAYAQTSGNKSIENTFKTLAGDMKFTDPEYVAALEVLYKFARDGMFIDGVNSLDSDGAWASFAQAKAAFFYEHVWRIGFVKDNPAPELDQSLFPPVRYVSDASIKRQNPGGTGMAEGIYSKIAPERLDTAMALLDWWSSDESVKFYNDMDEASVSTNVNVQASDDPIALKYAKECSNNQTTYLDWFWPPEVTRAFQEQQQGLVADSTTPDKAAAEIQKVLDELYNGGYKFEA